MSRRKKKPYDPAAAERHRAERAENAEMIGFVRHQPSTALNIDPRTGRLTGAWRNNCFNTLLVAGSKEREAVDWLDDIVRTAEGENGRDRRPDHIRASAEGAPGQNVSQEAIAAGLTVAVIRDSLYPACCRLLFDLIEPDAAHDGSWRGVVARATGETNEAAQGAMVRAAAANLAWVRANIARLEREYVDRRRRAA